jgi:hypothetical protein
VQTRRGAAVREADHVCPGAAVAVLDGTTGLWSNAAPNSGVLVG